MQIRLIHYSKFKYYKSRKSGGRGFSSRGKKSEIGIPLHLDFLFAVFGYTQIPRGELYYPNYYMKNSSINISFIFDE